MRGDEGAAVLPTCTSLGKHPREECVCWTTGKPAQECWATAAVPKASSLLLERGLSYGFLSWLGLLKVFPPPQHCLPPGSSLAYPPILTCSQGTVNSPALFCPSTENPYRSSCGRGLLHFPDAPRTFCFNPRPSCLSQAPSACPQPVLSWYPGPLLPAQVASQASPALGS